MRRPPSHSALEREQIRQGHVPVWKNHQCQNHLPPNRMMCLRMEGPPRPPRVTPSRGARSPAYRLEPYGGEGPQARWLRSEGRGHARRTHQQDRSHYNHVTSATPTQFVFPAPDRPVQVVDRGLFEMKGDRSFPNIPKHPQIDLMISSVLGAAFI